MPRHSAKWSDPSWENGNIPGLNLKNPPRKDTVIVPSGGYAVSAKRHYVDFLSSLNCTAERN